ncbi:MAG: terminase [Gammaproteobacteria bacterium]|nr:terminase [Gammaproteobacteria bacterium]
MNGFAEIVDMLADLPEAGRKAVVAEALSATADRLWVPNPGPQTEAFFSEADEVFYGGQAGGGKSDLMIGLSLTEHRRSLLLRRTNKEALGIVERMTDVIGSRTGWNGQDNIWRIGERVIDVGGCQLDEDKQKYKGVPHDFIGFDEVSDFTESQYVFITGWNRTTIPGQRCRVIAAGNPPTRPEGLWVLKRWGAWLDPTHPNPAQPGEVRWYTTIDGVDTEVSGPGPHMIAGEPILARSRTFIPAELSDNPDLAADGKYDAVLAALPEELRLAYREGRFDASLRDGAYQVIPTDWVRKAQARWTPTPPKGIPMCAIGADVAQGGDDRTVLAIRHDGWYAPLTVLPGKLTPDGKTVAGLIVAHRRDGAKVIIDMGGGWGGAAYEWLKDNDIDVTGHKGAEGSLARTKDKQLKFFNRRSEVMWRFREALDPSQPQGSTIMLPDDPELVADLTAPTFEVGPRGIKVESKEHVCDRLKRSTDKGDAVVMAWSGGGKMASHFQQWQAGGRRPVPKVVMGHPAVRRISGRV